MSEEHPADLGDEDDDDGEHDSDGALEHVFAGGRHVGWLASMSGVASFAVSAYMVGTIVGFQGFPVDDFSPVGQSVRGAVFHAFVPLTVLGVADISSLASFVFRVGRGVKPVLSVFRWNAFHMQPNPV